VNSFVSEVWCRLLRNGLSLGRLISTELCPLTLFRPLVLKLLCPQPNVLNDSDILTCKVPLPTQRPSYSSQERLSFKFFIPYIVIQLCNVNQQNALFKFIIIIVIIIIFLHGLGRWTCSGIDA